MSIGSTQPGYEPVGQAAVKALRATCQILKIKKGKKEFPIAHGCGVLFQFDSSHYLFTNAHVIDDIEKEKLFILVKNGETISIAGQHRFSSMPASGNRKDDPLDMAVVKLHSGAIERLLGYGYCFLSLNDIKVDHEIDSSDEYMVVGYPATKTKVNIVKKVVQSTPFIFRTIPFKGGIEKAKFTSGLHFAVSYPIGGIVETESEMLQRGPKPHGISGSGLWLVDQLQSAYSIRLIGIQSDYLENRAAFVSLRVDLFLDIARQKFDTNIPRSAYHFDLGNDM